MPKTKTLSVIIPVYNEKPTITQTIKKVRSAKASGLKKQIIIVDDGSSDGTREILKKMKTQNKSLKIILKDKNGGKGSAVREGFKHASGDFTIIQDADLEYDPKDYTIMLKPAVEGHADVVYGSRFLGPHRSFLFWNYVANKFLTLLTNILYNTILTDMETCYKLFKTDIVKNMKLRSNSFNIEPEITAKVLKKKYKIYEVPINFYGRDYREGKKISAWDGVVAFFALFYYRFFD